MINPAYSEVEDEHLGHFLGEFAPLVQLKRTLEVATRVIRTARPLNIICAKNIPRTAANISSAKRGLSFDFSLPMGQIVWFENDNSLVCWATNEGHLNTCKSRV